MPGARPKIRRPIDDDQFVREAAVAKRLPVRKVAVQPPLMVLWME